MTQEINDETLAKDRPMKTWTALAVAALLGGCTSFVSYETRDGRIVESHGTWHLGAPSHTHTVEYEVVLAGTEIAPGVVCDTECVHRTGEWFSHGPSALSQILPSAATVAAAHEIRHGLEDSGDEVSISNENNGKAVVEKGAAVANASSQSSAVVIKEDKKP